MTFSGDIGAVDGIYRKDLFLQVRWMGCAYLIAVSTKPLSVTVRCQQDGCYGYETPQPAFRDVIIGYALKRAICRGIDTCEVIETECAVFINLGVLT